MECERCGVDGTPQTEAFLAMVLSYEKMAAEGLDPDTDRETLRNGANIKFPMIVHYPVSEAPELEAFPSNKHGLVSLCIKCMHEMELDPEVVSPGNPRDAVDFKKLYDEALPSIQDRAISDVKKRVSNN